MRACAGSNFANAAVALVVGQPDCHGLCFGLCVKLHRSDFFCVLSESECCSELVPAHAGPASGLATMLLQPSPLEHTAYRQSGCS